MALDNWIYVTGGLTGGKVTSPKNLDHAAVEFGRADFRFLPDCSRFEAADGGGQFGMTFDDFGHRFICYNRVQVQHVVLPSRYLRRNPHLAATGTVQDCPADMVAEPLADMERRPGSIRSARTSPRPIRTPARLRPPAA